MRRWSGGVLFAFLAVPATADPRVSFAEPRAFTVACPIGLGRVPLGDWNGNGRTDLAAECGDSLWILAGDGEGGFRPALQLPLGDHPVQIAAVDLNRDGRTDLLVYHCTEDRPACVPSGEFSAFLSEGDGRFTAPLRFRPAVSTAQGPPGGPYVLGFVVADLNRDGIPDLLLTLNPPGRDSVVLGRGDGTFANPTPGPFTFNLVGVADFSADGIPDVLTLGFYANAPQVSYGRGDGTFEDSVALDVCSSNAGGTCVVQIADIDGDGVHDLLVEDQAWGWVGNLRLFRGNGHGDFDPLARLPDALAGDDRQGFALSFADIDGDHLPDLIRIRDWYVDDEQENRIGFYTGNGSGEFSLSLEVRLPVHAHPVLADVNGDSKPDLVTSDGDQNVLVFLNTSK